MRSEFKNRLASFKKQADMGREWGWEIATGLIYSSKNPEEVERSAKELANWIMEMYKQSMQVMRVLQKPRIFQARMDQFAHEVAEAIEEWIDWWKEGAPEVEANHPADMSAGHPMYGWDDQPRDIKVFLKEKKKDLVKSWINHFEEEIGGDIIAKDFSIMKHVLESLLEKEIN